MIALINFIFFHRDTYKGCGDLSLAIAKYVTKSDQISDGTLLQLYQEVAKHGFGDKYLGSITHSEIQINETKIPSLYTCHKDLFFQESPDKWKNICLFEHHFSKEYKKSNQLPLAQEIEEKWKFWRLCKSSYFDEAHSVIKPTIAQRH